MVDVSASGKFGTQKQLKQDVITDYVLYLPSLYSNNDKSESYFFTDKIEKFIPPKKESHVLRIIRDFDRILSRNIKKQIFKTGFKYLTNVIKKEVLHL